MGCGAVMTVVVSAAMALWSREDSGWKNWEDQTSDETLREIVNWRGHGFSAEKNSWTSSIQTRLATPVYSDDPAEVLSYWYKARPHSIEGSWPINVSVRENGDQLSWAQASTLPWFVMQEVLFEVRSGWPVAAMRSRRVTDWDDAKFTYVTQCDGLEIPASGLGERMRFTLEGNSLNSPYRPVPLVPVWPGFAVCSVFWAGVVGVVWYVPGMVRGAMRRRRGLCARCGYELRGLDACPECGTSTSRDRNVRNGASGIEAPSRLVGGAT